LVSVRADNLDVQPVGKRLDDGAGGARGPRAVIAEESDALQDLACRVVVDIMGHPPAWEARKAQSSLVISRATRRRAPSRRRRGWSGQ
jgi:hypothetical protein